MRIGIVKPDYKITGGFEIVLDKIMDGLRNYGHVIDYIKVDMTEQKLHVDNINIPSEIYNKNQEFFRYATKIEDFQNLKLDGYDLVIATQPPSYAINHDKVVVLFYHHLKVYYDLFEAYIECGLTDEEIHRKSKDIVRRIDSYYLTNDKFYLAGSRHVAKRLKNFNNVDKNVHLFLAGINEDYYNYSGSIEYNVPICVGRHEFPKRPELFVHAMKHIKDVKGKIIGEGGRTNDLKKIDSYLTYLHNEGKEINDDFLWKKLAFNLNYMKDSKYDERQVASNVIFTGRVSHNELINEYARALCVVCPSFEEDYGLTAIEAMAFKKPVIACNDGGGYLEFIEDGYNGFIVEPTGEAIAKAIKYLVDNPEIAKKMGQAAFEFSRKYSWANSIRELNETLTSIAGN